MMTAILLGGLIMGVVHFIVVGVLYQNPWVAGMYKAVEKDPAMRYWPNVKQYITTMALGTQVEVFILAAAYYYLRALFSQPESIMTAIVLSVVLSAVRVYPRFWNMWIQTAYPRKLLAVEAVNGTLGTFIIVVGLKFLPF